MITQKPQSRMSPRKYTYTWLYQYSSAPWYQPQATVIFEQAWIHNETLMILVTHYFLNLVTIYSQHRTIIGVPITESTRLESIHWPLNISSLTQHKTKQNKRQKTPHKGLILVQIGLKTVDAIRITLLWILTLTISKNTSKYHKTRGLQGSR